MAPQPSAWLCEVESAGPLFAGGLPGVDWHFVLIFSGTNGRKQRLTSSPVVYNGPIARPLATPGQDFVEKSQGL